MSQVPLHEQRTILTDIDIPFTRLVAFFVKATLAAIPAFIIVWIIVIISWMIVAAIFGGTFSWRMHRWPY